MKNFKLVEHNVVSIQVHSFNLMKHIFSVVITSWSVC